jgi:hypothetical protein
LYNWRRKDNNIEMLHTFTESLSEQAILTACVEMEMKGAELIKQSANPHIVANILFDINESLRKTRSSLEWDALSSWNTLLADYKNLTYEQWRQDELTFPCDIFLQSPLLHIVYKYLDINFANDYLVTRNANVRQLHMPASHKLFIHATNGIRSRCNEEESLREVYNNCLTQLIDLRNNLIFREADKSETASEELAGYYFR